MSFRGIPTSVLQRAMFFLGVCTLLTGMLRGEAGKYLGPIDVVASPDQKALYVVEMDAQRIDVLDAATNQVVRSIACPAAPTGLAVPADGSKLYVTCGVTAGHRVRGRSQHRQRAEHDCGRTQSVCSRAAAGRQAPDCVQSVQQRRVDRGSGGGQGGGARAGAPRAGGERRDARRCAGLGRQSAARRIRPMRIPWRRKSRSFRWPTWPRPRFDCPTAVRVCGTSACRRTGSTPTSCTLLSRYRMPTTQLERGWMNTNALSVIDVPGKTLVNTVLLDEIDLGAANPYAVTTSADGSVIYVSHAGTHELSIINTQGLLQKLLSRAQDDGGSQGTGARRTRPARTPRRPWWMCPMT